jgi:hypothetical protein
VIIVPGWLYGITLKDKLFFVVPFYFLTTSGCVPTTTLQDALVLVGIVQAAVKTQPQERNKLF